MKRKTVGLHKATRMNNFFLKSALIAVLLFHSFFSVTAQTPRVEIMTSGTKTSIRGLSAVDDNIIWVSGSNGMVGRSNDGGKSWKRVFIASGGIPITVNPGTPATPGPITGTATACPQSEGLIYSIAPVANATTYTWAVPAGWSIISGQGGTSIAATAGTTGCGA